MKWIEMGTFKSMVLRTEVKVTYITTKSTKMGLCVTTALSTEVRVQYNQEVDADGNVRNYHVEGGGQGNKVNHEVDAD
jgi:hypothetical protein